MGNHQLLNLLLGSIPLYTILGLQFLSLNGVLAAVDLLDSLLFGLLLLAEQFHHLDVLKESQHLSSSRAHLPATP